MNKNFTNSQKFYDELDEFDLPDQITNDNLPNVPLTLEEAKNLKKINSLSYPQVFKTLENIGKISTTYPQKKFKDIYQLVYDPELLSHSLGTIMRRTGSLSMGVDQLSTDSINYKTILKISNELKENSFKFKPIRRIYIDKTGKDKTINKQVIKLYKENQLSKEKIKELKIRPLGILTTRDKILAESLRLILDTIYEPEFKRINLNFGFRPKLGCQHAIFTHITKAKAHKFAIEADITGAFDNVNHDKLISILKYKIDDNRFLKLIKDGLESGVFFAGNIEPSKVGTTQGSNISPLLYNIYFHEFDKFISNEFTTMVENQNKTEKRLDSPRNPFYTKITKNKAALTKSFLKERQNSIQLYKLDPDNNKYQESITKLKNLKKEILKLNLIQKRTSPLSFYRKTIKFQYTRYADDWIFTTNASLLQTETYKNLFSNWIKDNLLLDLSESKTKITALDVKHSKVKFLGFALSYYPSKSKYIRRVGLFRLKTKSGFRGVKFNAKVLENVPLGGITKKISRVSLIAAFDKQRVLKRLIEARFVKQKRSQYYGRSKAEWTVLEIPDIIERYNQIIRGYLNYYGPILKYTSELNYLLYLLQYSCLHTLANKGNCRISKIIKKYGKSPKIEWEIVRTRKLKDDSILNFKEKKTTSLINWAQAKEIINKSITNFKQNYYKRENTVQIDLDNIPTFKYNWRTKFKLTKHCSVCGSEEQINYHHVKHIKVGQTSGFLQIMKQLNRKQIPVCKNCHLKIHKGEYNNIKLSDLFDERLIIL